MVAFDSDRDMWPLEAQQLRQTAGAAPAWFTPRRVQKLCRRPPISADYYPWGAKTRCVPEKSPICRQDANFGTPQAEMHVVGCGCRELRSRPVGRAWPRALLG
jgi:hypothetical protein